MDIRVFEPEELETALGAVRAIRPSTTRAQDELLRAIALLHGREIDLAELRRPTLAQVAGRIVDPHRRKRLVELAVVMAMVDGEVSGAAAAAVSRLSAALGVVSRTGRNLQRVAAQRRLLLRLDLGRQVFGKFMGEAFREEGLAGVREVLGPLLFNRAENRDKARRYRALGDLPAGSFGRAYHDHCASRGFPFPGERGGIPEAAIFHDLGHVLAGYDTDPDGEIQQAAFQAGFVREEGFIFLFFGIAQFHLGLKLTPIAEPEVGHLDVGRVMRALARGAACNADLSDRWNFWPLLPRPLEEVRGLLAIPPLVETRPAGPDRLLRAARTG